MLILILIFKSCLVKTIIRKQLQCVFQLLPPNVPGVSNSTPSPTNKRSLPSFAVQPRILEAQEFMAKFSLLINDGTI